MERDRKEDWRRYGFDEGTASRLRAQGLCAEVAQNVRAILREEDKSEKAK